MTLVMKGFTALKPVQTVPVDGGESMYCGLVLQLVCFPTALNYCQATSEVTSKVTGTICRPC